MSPEKPELVPAGEVSTEHARPGRLGLGRGGGSWAARAAQRPRIAGTAAVSPWIWVSLVVGLSFLVRAGLALARPGPWILPDELLYVDLARSIADGRLPAVQGTTTFGWGVIYPLIVSPAWAVFGDGLAAYRAALVINAFVMSLAAVPAYLLARLVVGQRSAVLVSAGTVLVPAMALTGSVMTENAAYPLFVASLWLVARAVRSPTLPAQAFALVTLVVLVTTRVQGVALVLAFAVALMTYAILLDAGARRTYVVRLAPTAVTLGLLALGTMLVFLAGGSKTVLAGHSGAAGHIALAQVPRQFGLHLGGLLVTVAVVPFVAGVVMIVRGLSRRAPERYRLYAAVAWPTIGGTLCLVTVAGTSMDLNGAKGVNERYLLYLVPLLLIGLVAWFEADPGRRRLGFVVLGAAACVVASMPFGDLAPDATFYAPSLAPWVAVSLPDPLAGMLVGSALFAWGAVWLRLGVRGAHAVAMGLAAWLALASLIAAVAFQRNAVTASATQPGVSRTWIDDAVPAGDSVSVVWAQSTDASAPDPDYYPLMASAALNRSVGRFLRLGHDTFYEPWLPTTPVRVRRNGNLVDPAGEVVVAPYALVSCSLAVAGEVVVRTADRRLALVRTGDRPLRVHRARCSDTSSR